MKALLSTTAFLALMALCASATTIHVPGQYSSVQGGINAATNGDTVLVGPGNYLEQITIQNAVIHLLSSAGADSTIIRWNDNWSMVGIANVYNSSEIAGFKLWRFYGYYTGPAIHVYDGSPSVHHNILSSEADACIGGILEGTGSPLILNNTVLCNNEGGFDTYRHGFEILSATVTPIIKNNIVYAPWTIAQDYCVYNLANAFVNHDYNDFYGSPLLGLTLNATEFNANPLLVSWSDENCHLQAGSPCIDTGVPALLDPDGTRSDMGCFYYPHGLPQLDITLTRILFPPPPAGLIMFRISAVNHGPVRVPFWVWCRIKFPDGTWTQPTLGPIQINPPLDATVTRVRSQNIPSNWPGGLYYYVGYVGGTFSYPAIDSSFFTFTKIAGESINPFEPAPYCQGEPFPGEVISAEPFTSNLVTVTPNPFNLTTVIRYHLPNAGEVSLRVYDATGKLAATLVDGWREAGNHEVTFDPVGAGGSKLASGLYFVRIQAEGFSAVQKIVLLK